MALVAGELARELIIEKKRQEFFRKKNTNKVLAEVKAEIDEKISHYDHFENSNTANGLRMAKEIIEKCKGDSEC